MNEKVMQNKLNPTSSRGIFDYTLIVVLIVNLVYSLLVGAIPSNEVFIMVFSYICTPICIVLGVYLCGKKYNENYFLQVKFEKTTLKSWLAMILITFGMMFGLSELNNLFVEFLQSLGYTLAPITLPEKNFLNVTLVIVFICIVPAVFEEFLMRGLILGGLKSGGKVFAVLVSATLFALFHMSPQQTIYQFLVGALYALIVVMGGGWQVTLVSHLVNNLFIVLNEYFFKLSFTVDAQIILTILGLISLALGVFLLLFKQEKQTQNKQELLISQKEFIQKPSWGIIICLVFWVVNLIGL